MLFAEIFSGASQLWFLTAWGWFVTVPLYLMHTVFLFYLALKTKKTTLTQLYLFGVIFGLYEALITKVLWVGYFDQSGPTWGTFLGLAINEFPVLVFFWHPIFSFILPILTYEILTKTSIVDHQDILKKTKLKNMLLIILCIGISTFILNGNQFDLISANSAFIGTLILIGIVYLLLNKKPLSIKHLETLKPALWILALLILYGVAFTYLLPERIPDTLMPYLSVLAFYVITIFLLKISKKGEPIEVEISNTHYQIKDLWIGIGILLLMINTLIWIPEISTAFSFIFYLSYFGVGIILFLMTLIKGVLPRKLKDNV